MIDLYGRICHVKRFFPCYPRKGWMNPPQVYEKESNRVYERMIHLYVGIYQVRVWVSIKSLDDLDEDLHKKLNMSLGSAFPNNPKRIKEIVEHFSRQSNVVAVEVLDQQQDGILVYNDWP